jgi:2-dehydropantoate 2-reductase
VPDRSIAVYGAGAVGGYLGGVLRLANPDLTVTLIGRQGLVDAVRAHSLRLRGAGMERTVDLDAVTSAPTGETCDLVILAVRTDDVDRSIEDVRRLMGSGGQVLAVQNGVGTEEILARELGQERVIVGTFTVSVGMEAPGIVMRYSQGGGLALSTMTGDPPPVWLVQAFERTGMPTICIEDYRALRWSKLLLNMLGAPVTAILDINLADLVASTDLFQVEQMAFREAGRVMDAQGIETVSLPGYPVPLARLAMRLPASIARRVIGTRMAKVRAGRAPTMRVDMARGRSEVDTLNGAVVRGGAVAGRATPVNEALTRLTLDLVAHPERRDEFRRNPDRLLVYLRDRGISL